MTKRKNPEDHKKSGRPSIYTPELADRICKLVSTMTVGIDKICEQFPDLPDSETIIAWRVSKPGFSGKYSDAKRAQAELYAEETLDIADAERTYVDTSGNVRIDPGAVAHQKLRINARQWHASKLAPKVYGDRHVVEQVTTENGELKKEIESLRAQLAEKSKKDF